MPPLTPTPATIRPFASAAAFEAWLAEHHATAAELWLQIYKKGSGTPTVTYAEALDVALCYGWIDGQKQTFDEASFLQRFTPRRARSKWSQVNTRHVERLAAAGRLRPPGLREIEAAKADGRWAEAYAPASQMTVPDDLLAAIEADPAALATFRALGKQNLYALGYRTRTAKKAETRERRIREFVAMLARGETLYPEPRLAARSSAPASDVKRPAGRAPASDVKRPAARSSAPAPEGKRPAGRAPASAVKRPAERPRAPASAVKRPAAPPPEGKRPADRSRAPASDAQRPPAGRAPRRPKK
ncbi:MAG TPA: YdeI/OmpD-associated family protein [Polyangiaceae bacterium]|nr:YdeI/OmpD-associated family protein [Polyangiaceae bacterium]